MKYVRLVVCEEFENIHPYIHTNANVNDGQLVTDASVNDGGYPNGELSQHNTNNEPGKTFSSI